MLRSSCLEAVVWVGGSLAAESACVDVRVVWFAEIAVPGSESYAFETG